ncbi:unnamed protein product [Symbiodinium natans]|uniref:Uncharacterized protein n=1 Tax=Symbiodinium natans TaxID=878477 RepID=A0A812L2H6_9DINO|nr:unnamed protein product [Symbiodinium natans]
MGDPACWGGQFQPERCCDTAAYGPHGNADCWNEAFTFARCCPTAAPAPTASWEAGSCWSGIYGPELCCGPGGGHPRCWDEVYTYERCCPETLQRALTVWWLLPCHPGCLPSWSSEAIGLLAFGLLSAWVLYVLSHWRARRLGSLVSAGGVLLPPRSWAPDFLRMVCLCCQIAIHFMQKGPKDPVHPKHVELAVRRFAMLALDPGSTWLLLWLQRSIHICASSGWFVLSAYLLSQQDVPKVGAANLWLRKVLRQAPAAVLGGFVHLQVSGASKMKPGQQAQQMLEWASGLAGGPVEILRHEMACWLVVALCMSLRSRVLRFMSGAGVTVILAHVHLQALRVYDLVATTHQMSDRSSANVLLGEFLPIYLLSFVLSHLRPWRILPPICALLIGVLGSGLLSALFVDNVGGTWPPYVDPRLHFWLDLPMVLGTAFFLKASESAPRCYRHLLAVMAASSLMAQVVSHRLLLKWIAAVRGEGTMPMVDSLLAIPGFIFLSLLGAYLLTALIGIPGTWLIGKLVTPCFSLAPPLFFAAYLATFAFYLASEDEVFSIATKGQAFWGECPFAAFMKAPHLVVSGALSAMAEKIRSAATQGDA